MIGRYVVSQTTVDIAEEDAGLRKTRLDQRPEIYRDMEGGGEN